MNWHSRKSCSELAREGLNPDVWNRAKGFARLRENLGAKGHQGCGAGGLPLGEAGDPDHSTLRKMLESVFREIEEGETQVLIAVDELPEFLLTLQKAEDGPGTSVRSCTGCANSGKLSARRSAGSSWDRSAWTTS